MSNIHTEIAYVSIEVERLAHIISTKGATMRPKALAGTAQDLAKWTRTLDNMCARAWQLDRAARDAAAS